MTMGDVESEISDCNSEEQVKLIFTTNEVNNRGMYMHVDVLSLDISHGVWSYARNTLDFDPFSNVMEVGALDNKPYACIHINIDNNQIHTQTLNQFKLLSSNLFKNLHEIKCQ
jgi:hypothetical protein